METGDDRGVCAVPPNGCQRSGNQFIFLIKYIDT